MDWLHKFKNDGYCVIEDIFTEKDTEDMKHAMDEIIEELDVQGEKAIFTTRDDEKHTKDKYFLESVDKIRYFYEEEAFDKAGNLIVSKDRALNKVGHALHVLHPVFRRMTFSSKIKELFRQLDFIDPIVPQSMYIFKQPGIGGEVTPHIDATFLIGEPPGYVVGVWIALDEATLENGCLWFVPGSHKGNVADRKFVRTGDDSVLLKFEGSHRNPPDPSSFVATPVPKGSCVLIHGLVWHKSEANKSIKPRHAYTFHVFDRGNAKWNEKSWLQPTETYNFPSLFESNGQEIK